MHHTVSEQAGFTLVELLVVMGLIAIMAGLSFVNFIRPQTSASISGSVQTLMADIKSQQLKAMAGDSMSSTTAESHGVYIESDRYTLFKGTSYDGNDPDNFTVPAESGITFTSTFQGDVFVFSKGAGELLNYNNNRSDITITNTVSGESKELTLSELGTISSN